jgi:hypothetical protein
MRWAYKKKKKNQLADHLQLSLVVCTAFICLWIAFPPIEDGEKIEFFGQHSLLNSKESVLRLTLEIVRHHNILDWLCFQMELYNAKR